MTAPISAFGTSLLAKYADYLPVTAATPLITLGEGNTPLVEAQNLTRHLGLPCKIYFKLEGANPTGSFKDRGMVVAIAKAKEEGANAVICASTGNTSASAAAYSARASLKCYVVLPADHVALGKLAQAILYGACVVPIEGNFDEALDLVRGLAAQLNLTIVNSLNPYRLEGQKTGAFEIIEKLGEAPDYLFIPVGNAGNITAYYRGFAQWQGQGKCTKVPKMCGFEAEGAAAIVRKQVIAKPETFATAIRIGNPVSWKEAENAANQSGGMIGCVSDAEIRTAYTLLAKQEGIFCEPASAASLAGLLKSAQAKQVAEGSTCVCVLTGNGLKDPNAALQSAKADLTPIEPSQLKLKEAMKL